MRNTISTRNIQELNYILFQNGLVAEISESFSNATEYEINDLINMKIDDVFSILRLGPNASIENIDDKTEYFFFTQSLQPIFVYIELIRNGEEDLYIFKQKFKSKVKDRFAYVYQLMSDNLTGVSIYSVPDITLLMANQRYLDFLDPPFNCAENTFGKKLHDFLTEFHGSPYEEALKTTISSGKSQYLKEFEFHRIELGITYWNETITPIKEDGKVKYIVTNTEMVTGNFMHKEQLEEKNRILKQQNELIHAILSNAEENSLVTDKNILNMILNKNSIELSASLKETHLKLLQLEREKNEMLEKAMEMKDEFLSMISHELRTPLNVISTAVQAINYFCKDGLPDKAKEYIKMIKQNTNRQLRLVNNLLDITRANVGQININKKNIDIVFLTKAITESVHAYASQKGISLTFQSSLEKKVIGIDDDKYERILLNLLSNAIKFTPTDKFIKITMYLKNDNVCIDIEDGGIGIPNDKLSVIFERFGQVNSSLSCQAEGAGIGLSLVKKFVDALGGNLSVTSIVGKGSTFTVMLPSETINEVTIKNPDMDFMDNRLVQVTSIEFSDIYL